MHREHLRDNRLSFRHRSGVEARAACPLFGHRLSSTIAVLRITLAASCMDLAGNTGTASYIVTGPQSSRHGIAGADQAEHYESNVEATLDR
jgi:hypothetical protein